MQIMRFRYKNPNFFSLDLYYSMTDVKWYIRTLNAQGSRSGSTKTGTKANVNINKKKKEKDNNSLDDV